MKRKSKSLITGGLLGLAGLGLLPRGAEASTDLPAVAPDPSLGEALAENPSPVIAPAPSAQTTAPQVDEPQPVWSPEDKHSVAITAASASANAPLSSAPLSSAPLSLTGADGEADVDIAAAAQDLEATPSATSAVVDDVAEDLANLPVQPAAADVAIAPPVAPSLESNAISPAAAIVEDQPQDMIAGTIAPPTSLIASENTSEADAVAIAPLAKPLRELSPQPAAAKPLPPTADLTKPVAAPAIAASPRRETAPRSMRASSATVQALMRDLRAAAGLAEYAPMVALSRRGSQPEALRRGPQLPQLPSDSARRRQIPGLASQSATSPAALPSTAAATQNGQTSLRRGPQLPHQRPDVSARATDVALALATAQPVMSPAPAETMSLPSISPTAPVTTAQTPPAADAAQIRDDLQIAPLTTTATSRRTFPPSPNAGIPSGFGANGGDVFFSASLAGADRIRPEADGSLSAGFGLGNSRRVVGVELNYNLLSIRSFGENGGFDVKVHRQVYSGDETQVAAAVGLNNFASYGPEAGGSPSSLYGVVTAAHLLQPDNPVNRMPITGSVGLGGGSFSDEGSDVGVFAGVGLQVHPQFSLNTAWSGVGLNIGASIVPEPTIPLTLNLLYGDVGNNTQAGSVAVLSIGYGFNFGPRF